MTSLPTQDLTFDRNLQPLTCSFDRNSKPLTCSFDRNSLPLTRSFDRYSCPHHTHLPGSECSSSIHVRNCMLGCLFWNGEYSRDIYSVLSFILAAIIYKIIFLDLFRTTMVNAKCDFCPNSYRKCPNAGYYKLSATLRSSLCLSEGAGINTICGDHFTPSDISDCGRLSPDAKPVFFPRQSSAAHDHPYHDAALSQDESEGIVITSFIFPPFQIFRGLIQYKIVLNNAIVTFKDNCQIFQY